MINIFGEDVDPDAPERDLEQEDMEHSFHIYHDPELFDWVNSIKSSKTDLRIAHSISKRGKGKDKQTVNVKPCPSMKTFDTFTVLQALQQSDIAAPYAYMVNERPHMTKEQAYLFLLHSVPAHDSFDKWVRKTNNKLMDDLMKTFDIGRSKALEYFDIYSDKELEKLLEEYKESNRWQKRNKKLKL